MKVLFKKICVLNLFIILSMLLCSYTNSEQNKKIDEYNLINITVKRYEYIFENKNASVKIYYPQIEGIKNNDIQSKVNTCLMNSALNDYENFWNMDGLNLKVDYTIAYLDHNYISVKFYGIGDAGSYPTSFEYAANINLSTGNKFSLEEIVNVDDLLNIVSNGTIHLKVENDFILEFYTYQEMAERFKTGSMSEADSAFYFTTNRIGLYVYFPHAVGDFRSIEIDFDDIYSEIRKNDLFWKNIKE